MKAIVSVIGKDKVGILAFVCNALADKNVNILDVSQSVLSGYFTMSMLVDASACTVSFTELSESLRTEGEKNALDIRIQREEIFAGMYNV